MPYILYTFPTALSNMWVDVPMCCVAVSRLMVEDLEVVRVFGHRTSFSSEPVCLSFETFETLQAVLVAEITGARLAQVEGIC